MMERVGNFISKKLNYFKFNPNGLLNFEYKIFEVQNLKKIFKIKFSSLDQFTPSISPLKIL